MFIMFEDVNLFPALMPDLLLLIVYILLAVFIAWIWVDYFRLIDVFEKENLGRVMLTFFMGAASVFLVFGLHALWQQPFGLQMDGTFTGDLLYCTFSIGLVEESAKAVPVLIALLLFRRHINEPVDYISTFSVAALGFAAAENVLYFSDYGPNLISSRAVLSNVGHMMFASLTAYGAVLIRFRKARPGWLILPAFLLLASFFHGVYDMGLLHANAGWLGTVITIVFFMLGVSVFATILNNALNISPFFTYKHVIHTSAVAVRLLIYYAILFTLQCLIMGIYGDFRQVFRLVLSHSYTILPIVLITVLRLSRLKLIKDRWTWLKPELPFGITFSPRFSVSVKGDPYSEFHVNKYLESYVFLCPAKKDSPYLHKCRKAYIFRKLYLNGDVAHYVARIFMDEALQKSTVVLLQVKHKGLSMLGTAPLIAVLHADRPEELHTSLDPVATSFIEWAAVRPMPEANGSSV